MLGLAGLLMMFFAFIMFIKFLVHAARPKMDVPIKEYFFAKLKTDLFKIYPEHRHARIAYKVNGKEYNAELIVAKKMKAKEGENIRITYKKSDPNKVRYWFPKMELLQTLTIFLVGAVIAVISFVVTGFLQSL
jgi:hypothetical protein